MAYEYLSDLSDHIDSLWEAFHASQDRKQRIEIKAIYNREADQYNAVVGFACIKHLS